jgi:hypothetical protein
MSQQYKAAAKVIEGAIASINAILVGPEDEMHRLKLSQSLQREADYLLLVTGAGDLNENKDAVILGPATTIGGRPISKLPRITERDLKPSDDAVLNLKEAVENAVVYFGPDSDSAGILANIPDLVIRGVAKKAGLKVTKEQPKELTVEFIDEIKAALLAKGLVSNGGVKESHIIPAEDIGAQMGAGVVEDFETQAEVKATVDEDLNKGLADAIMGGSPSEQPGDGIASKVKPETDQPKKKSTGK